MICCYLLMHWIQRCQTWRSSCISDRAYSRHHSSLAIITKCALILYGNSIIRWIINRHKIIFLIEELQSLVNFSQSLGQVILLDFPFIFVGESHPIILRGRGFTCSFSCFAYWRRSCQSSDVLWSSDTKWSALNIPFLICIT